MLYVRPRPNQKLRKLKRHDDQFFKQNNPVKRLLFLDKLFFPTKTYTKNRKRKIKVRLIEQRH